MSRFSFFMNSVYSLIFILYLWNIANYQSVYAIRGGEEDHSDIYKFQVSIQVKKQSGFYEHGCGGSIIDDYHILTAAHCFISKYGQILNLSNEKIQIVAGTNRLDGKRGILRFVDKVFISKEYQHVGRYALGDIAVVKLQNSLYLNSDQNQNMEKIKLPKKSSHEKYENQIATVSGFGVVDFKPKQSSSDGQQPVISSVRKFLNVTIVHKNKCSPYDSIICGIVGKKGSSGAQGFCHGDSGGPMIYKNTLIGIISRASKNCDMRITVGKFTLVSHYLDFINKAKSSFVDKSDMIILPDMTNEAKHHVTVTADKHT